MKAYWFAVILLLSGVSIPAGDHLVGITLGRLEYVDLRYEYLWSHVGIGVTPGIAQLVATKINSDEVMSISWNPSVSLFAPVCLSENVYLAPGFTFLYAYGSARSYVETYSFDGGMMRTRSDSAYYELGVGVQYRMDRVQFEIKPGIAYKQGYTYIIQRSGRPINTEPREASKFTLPVSGTIGYRF